VGQQKKTEIKKEKKGFPCRGIVRQANEIHVHFPPGLKKSFEKMDE